MTNDVDLHCPICDEEFSADQEHDCSEAAAVAHEDECVMCGSEYQSYLAHLKNCPVRERHEVEAAGVTDGDTPEWEERPEVGQKGRPE